MLLLGLYVQSSFASQKETPEKYEEYNVSYIKRIGERISRR